MVVKRTDLSASGRADAKSIYKSSRRYSDRNAKSTDFPAFTVRCEKIQTLLLLLQSDESDVIEKALYHIDKFASMGTHQLYALEENRIYESALKLIKSENAIVKKFIFKLLVQLIHNIDECRKKLLGDAALIEETRNIFTTSSDDNLVEFSCILLHYVCDDLRHIHAMTQDEAFVRALFTRFRSFDPDILLQSMRLLNLIMSNSMLITAMLGTTDFPLKNLQIELKNDCREIRVAALESFQIISSLREHPFKDEFASERLIEVIHAVSMEDDTELKNAALKTLGNFCRDERGVAVKVSQHLPKYLQLFLSGEASESKEELLQVLISLATFEDNVRIMQENGFIKPVIDMLKQSGSMAACDALLVLSKNVGCLAEILKENVYEILLKSQTESNCDKILTTFHSLINLQGLNQLIEVAAPLADSLAEILKNSSSTPLKLKVIAILDKLASYSQLKATIARFSELSKEVFFCLIYASYSTKLIVRLFHLIASYIDQASFREAFVEFNASELIEIYLTSQVTQVRSSVCMLINLAANHAQLASHLIDSGVLSALLRCDFECSICSECFESLLNSDVSLKFSLRRRLEASDRVRSGFYASRCTKLDWTTVREVMKTDMQSPLHPIYTINFDADCVGVDCRKIHTDRNLSALKSAVLHDECFEGAETAIKVKIIAITVASFLQTDDHCSRHHFATHLSELKFKFASSVIPLGSLIYGNSFEAALLFKALADQVNLAVSFVTDVSGKSWNQITDSGSGIVDLFFDIGKIYGASSCAARKYLQNIS